MSFATAEQNAAALEHFIYLPVSREMIHHLAQKASGVIQCEGQQTYANNVSLPITPPTTPPQSARNDLQLPSLEDFIGNLVERSHVQIPTLMTSLVYLARLQERLPPVAKGMKCTAHRIFLASLILAAKNLNDSSPKNKHWARYTSVPGYPHFSFSLTEVNLMEKQLLSLLEWDMRVSESHLYTHLEPFLAPIRAYQARQAERARIEEQLVILRARKQKLEISAAATEAQRRVMGDYTVFDSPRSINNSYASRPKYYASSHSHSSSCSTSRTPSLSPPSRSGSADTVATSPSSIAESFESMEIPVHIQEMFQHPPAGYAYSNGSALDLEPQVIFPTKKSKASNIFSRFLPTMSKPQMISQSIPMHGYVS